MPCVIFQLVHSHLGIVSLGHGHLVDEHIQTVAVPGETCMMKFSIAGGYDSRIDCCNFRQNLILDQIRVPSRCQVLKVLLDLLNGVMRLVVQRMIHFGRRKPLSWASKQTTDDVDSD